MPAFQVVDAVEDLVSLVSLAVLKAVQEENFGSIEHKIPITPWCRGHLARMVKRA